MTPFVTIESNYFAKKPLVSQKSSALSDNSRKDTQMFGTIIKNKRYSLEDFHTAHSSVSVLIKNVIARVKSLAAAKTVLNVSSTVTLNLEYYVDFIN